MTRAADARIEWACDKCGKPIHDGDGWIGVDDTAARRALHAKEKFDADRAIQSHVTGRRIIVQTFSELAAEVEALPPDARWYALHKKCDDGEGNDYWYAIERVRTVAQVLHRNTHLNGKLWIAHTDWDKFIARKITGQAYG